MLSFVFLGVGQMVATEEQWIALLVEVLAHQAELSGRAVTGAGLNSNLLARAAEQGLEQPPQIKRRKFKNLLTRLADDGLILLLPQTGADVLVAPTDKPGLLADERQSSRRSFPGIRRDLFTAFTWVNEKKPFYNVQEDRVEWFDSAREQIASDYIDIPAPDFELLKRRASDFIHKLDDELHAKGALALEHIKPMSSFSDFISNNGLRNEWHEFRTSSIIDSIRRWADSNGIKFRSDWLTSAHDGGSVKYASNSVDSEGFDKSAFATLSQLVSSLAKEDLSRIQIPLDIVLRIIKER
ncbi:hypothetical protein J7432_10525 [Xanthomonas axonopodis pv. begoniae]|nr:hypothetical protein [Xanthomonas axonopodis pv. begoniae]MBO9772218.1 hypothetical protein [Xanthomonas axonopodis pv. begoniae]